MLAESDIAIALPNLIQKDIQENKLQEASDARIIKEAEAVMKNKKKLNLILKAATLDTEIITEIIAANTAGNIMLKEAEKIIEIIMMLYMWWYMYPYNRFLSSLF